MKTKKFLVAFLCLVITFGIALPIMARTNPRPILKDGEFYSDVVMHQGNSSSNRGLMNVSANRSSNVIRHNGEVVGNFFFDKNADTIEIHITENVQIEVEWQASSQYARATLDGIGVYNLPQLMHNNGRFQSFNQIWILNITEIEDLPEPNPVVVNLGFIGYYLHEGRVLSTSFYWQALNEGDTIDWDAVDAAYADWVARGGLAPNRTQWRTSGPQSFTFDDLAPLGFGNFTLGQMETFYRSFFVSPGFILD